MNPLRVLINVASLACGENCYRYVLDVNDNSASKDKLTRTFY